MTLHKMTEFYAEWFSVCPNISQHHPILNLRHKIIQIELIQYVAPTHSQPRH
jgi:hypothetical protein